MPASGDDELAGNQQVVLILRLVLDRQGTLRHGELLDGHAVPQGRFVALKGLTDMVACWLERQEGSVPRMPIRCGERVCTGGR